jgi:hypothetical protein
MRHLTLMADRDTVLRRLGRRGDGGSSRDAEQLKD